MKTRLSEKAKSRMRKEQVSLDDLKQKISQRNSEVMKEGLLNQCQKDASSKDITKAKNESVNGNSATLGTGKKLMMLRCINHEEAMEGKDFVFTVHYINSENDFAFDSVLMPKKFANNKKYHNGIDSNCLKEVKSSALKINRENSSKDIDDKVTTSKMCDSTIRDNYLQSRNSDKQKAKANTKSKKEAKLDPKQTKEMSSPNNLENVTMDCEPMLKNVKMDKLPFNNDCSVDKMAKSPQDQRENENLKMKNSHTPTQKIVITTDDIAKNKLESCSSAQKSLKRNLKKDFADALHQSKGEKRFIVEVGCNDSLPFWTKSQKDANTGDSQNGKIDSSRSSQKTSTSLRNIVRNYKNGSDGLNLKKSSPKHGKKEQVNGKEKALKSPLCLKTSSGKSDMQEENVIEKSVHTSPTLICNRKPSIESQHITVDSNDNSSLQTSPPKDSDHINDKIPELCSIPSLPSDNDQSLQKLHSQKNTCKVASIKSLHKNSQSHVTDKENTKELTNENKLSKSALSFAASPYAETVPNAEMTSDLTLQKTSKQSLNISISPSKNITRKHKNKQQTNSKSSHVALNKEMTDENPSSAEESVQENTVKVNGEVDAKNPNMRNSSQQRTSSTESAVITEESSVLSHKKMSGKDKEQNKHVYEPRVTRSSLKKLNKKKN